MAARKSKAKKIILIVIIMLILGAGAFYLRYQKMVKTFRETTINNVDLKKVKDGEYPGSFRNFVCAVKLKVSVKNHKITGINIIKQDSGPGYEASAIIDSVIKAQSLKVDSVTGATGSSITLLKAIENALTGKELKK